MIKLLIKTVFWWMENIILIFMIWLNLFNILILLILRQKQFSTHTIKLRTTRKRENRPKPRMHFAEPEFKSIGKSSKSLLTWSFSQVRREQIGRSTRPLRRRHRSRWPTFTVTGIGGGEFPCKGGGFSAWHRSRIPFCPFPHAHTHTHQTSYRRLALARISVASHTFN